MEPEIQKEPVLAIIVPTYKEVENLEALLSRIASVVKASEILTSVWIMDDDSSDGSRKLIEGRDWGLPVTFVERKENRGLSPAVLDGIDASSSEFVLVMDADLSHPAEVIPDMLDQLKVSEIVFGSRYVEGGGTDHSWGVFRWLNSKVATVLALPLVKMSDPMSGFFVFSRNSLEGCGELNPVGYKIGMEILVKCRMKRIGEVPIQFANRIAGESKLTVKQQLLYLEHLRRLYAFRLFDR